ncbi:MAG: hypothetical protein AAGH82_02490 [Pseudomonadota bacterium]
MSQQRTSTVEMTLRWKRIPRQFQRLMEHGLLWMAVVAIAMAGFAHNVVAAQASGASYGVPIHVAANADLYRLPDGTLPVFCLAVDGEEHSGAAECEFCRLVDGTALPPLPGSVAKPPVYDEQYWPNWRVGLGGHITNSRARAPPCDI